MVRKKSAGNLCFDANFHARKKQPNAPNNLQSSMSLAKSQKIGIDDPNRLKKRGKSIEKHKSSVLATSSSTANPSSFIGGFRKKVQGSSIANIQEKESLLKVPPQ